MKSSCECGNKPSCSITCWETTECLHNWWPLEYSSAPMTWLKFIGNILSIPDDPISVDEVL
jgi:hypothetical protein